MQDDDNKRESHKIYGTVMAALIVIIPLAIAFYALTSCSFKLMYGTGL